MIFSIDLRQTSPSRHVTKNPSPQLLLFPLLTNRDARNPFRFRSYEKCRVASFKPSIFLSPIFRTHFQVPYPATLLFATLTKTAGVWGDSSRFGKCGSADARTLRCASLLTNHYFQGVTIGAGRPARRQCPCGAVRPGNTSCGGRPTPRCLRGFLFSAR